MGWRGSSVVTGAIDEQKLHMANPADITSQRDDAVAITGTTNDQREQSGAASGNGLTSGNRLTSDDGLPSDASTDAGDCSEMTVAQMLKLYSKGCC